jgi:hypothetical protein
MSQLGHILKGQGGAQRLWNPLVLRRRCANENYIFINGTLNSHFDGGNNEAAA